MSETKWTPGPWEFLPNKWNVQRTDPYVSKGSIIAPDSENGGIWFVAGIDNAPEEDANARLIAAAPDLYDALEAFAQWPVEHPVSYLQFEALRRNAISALAKARGEA